MTNEEFQSETVKRLSNLEQAVLAIQAHMTPRWLRWGAWGAFLGACLKELLSK